MGGQISRSGLTPVSGTEDAVILLFRPLFENRLWPTHCASLALLEKETLLSNIGWSDLTRRPCPDVSGRRGFHPHATEVQMVGPSRAN
jgi:hypothetical protein